MPSGWKFWPERPQGPVDGAFVQRGWVRPYRPGPLRVTLASVVWAACAYASFVGFLSVLAEPSAVGRIVTAVIATAVGGSLALLGSRIMATGVWVNDFGVRLHGLVRSESLAWSNVADVRRVEAETRVLGTPVRRSGQTLWLVLVDGSDRETALTDRGPDFLGRAEAFDMAAGAVERWFVETRPEQH